MSDSNSAADVDKEHNWELSSSASSPRSGSSSSTPTSLFSSASLPESPAETEISFSSIGSQERKEPTIPRQSSIASMPSHPNHILVGNVLYTPGHIRTMRDVLLQARNTGEFPNTTSAADDPHTIVEDHQHLQRLRDARGNPSLPPPEKYGLMRVDIARRIKARDEAQGGSTNLQEMDSRVQSWMNSINKEARMLEITQAALRRKGISNPTQDDLDAIAEEFMQIAERTLLDVANPLRMNVTRMEGNVSRFDSQLSGFDSAMTAQIQTLDTVMNTQVNTLDTAVTSLQSKVGTAVGASTDALSTAVGASTDALSTAVGASTDALSTAVGASTDALSVLISTLSTLLLTQSNTYNGSLNMLNKALDTVRSDLQQLTTNLPAIIATSVQAAVQAAVQDQLAAASYQHGPCQQRQATPDAPPSYATKKNATNYLSDDRTALPVYVSTMNMTSPASTQPDCGSSHLRSTPVPKSRLRRFLRRITMKWRSTRRENRKGSIPA